MAQIIAPLDTGTDQHCRHVSVRIPVSYMHLSTLISTFSRPPLWVFLLNFVTDHYMYIFTMSISMKGKRILLQLVLELLAPRKEIDRPIEINTSTIYDLVIQCIYEVS